MRWQMSKRQGDRLIGASQVHDMLGPIGLILPANESTARPLTRLLPDEEALTAAWREAVDTARVVNGEHCLTAKHVQRVVEQYLPADPDDAKAENTCTAEDLDALADSALVPMS